MKRIIKTSLFLALSLLSFNALAYMYLGNPTRPDTIWVPTHCEGGCVVQGHYLKFLTPVNEGQVVWVNSGGMLSGHYEIVR